MLLIWYYSGLHLGSTLLHLRANTKKIFSWNQEKYFQWDDYTMPSFSIVFYLS